MKIKIQSEIVLEKINEHGARRTGYWLMRCSIKINWWIKQWNLGRIKLINLKNFN